MGNMARVRKRTRSDVRNEPRFFPRAKRKRLMEPTDAGGTDGHGGRTIHKTLS
jgi:hypothetical protein